jgi:hypothetical protein
MKVTALAILVLIMTVPAINARTYVSLNGKFYIEYPDDWEQIDYLTVDIFLANRSAEKEMFEYDAVLAPSASSPFFEGDYLIVTLELTGELSQKQIDSIFRDMSDQSGIVHVESDDFLKDLKADIPSYNKASKTIALLNDIYQGQEVHKKNLVMMKFYQEGIATFYFYSNDSVFETSKNIFKDIVASFSTENIEAALPKEDLKVADLKTDEAGNLNTDKSNTILYLSIAVFVLLGIMILYFVRSKK